MKEIGGRCDIVFSCDKCGDCEYTYDDRGEVIHITRMYRVEGKDLCEHCLPEETIEM